VSGELWVVRKKEEKRNDKVPMTNDRKSVKEHLSEIQKGATQRRELFVMTQYRKSFLHK